MRCALVELEGADDMSMPDESAGGATIKTRPGIDGNARRRLLAAWGAVSDASKSGADEALAAALDELAGAAEAPASALRS